MQRRAARSSITEPCGSLLIAPRRNASPISRRRRVAHEVATKARSRQRRRRSVVRRLRRRVCWSHGRSSHDRPKRSPGRSSETRSRAGSVRSSACRGTTCSRRPVARAPIDDRPRERRSTTDRASAERRAVARAPSDDRSHERRSTGPRLRRQQLFSELLRHLRVGAVAELLLDRADHPARHLGILRRQRSHGLLDGRA